MHGEELQRWGQFELIFPFSAPSARASHRLADAIRTARTCRAKKKTQGGGTDSNAGAAAAADKTKGARALISALNPDGAVSVGGGAKKPKGK